MAGTTAYVNGDGTVRTFTAVALGADSIRVINLSRSVIVVTAAAVGSGVDPDTSPESNVATTHPVAPGGQREFPALGAGFWDVRVAKHGSPTAERMLVRIESV